MAVVQISRIQVRRGKANSGTGIPQLASGEIAWALDTQELYIGNGAVAEGSPAVGNTKILTELDLSANGNVLNLIQHIYKINEQGLQTGPSANSPVGRSLQDRFDDRVTLSDFISQADKDSGDYTQALQRAIDQLFLNTNITKASDDTTDGIRQRVILEIPAGTYTISGTIYIPSYASLIGAGADKTIINYNPVYSIIGTSVLNSYTISTISASNKMIGALVTGTGIPTGTTVSSVIVGTSITLSAAVTQDTISETFTLTLLGSAFQFVNDNSIPGTPDLLGNTLYNTQPRQIILSNLTIFTNTFTRPILQLDAVRDSVFNNLIIKGSWGGTSHPDSKGILMNAVSALVTTERNLFNNVVISGFTYAVYAKQDILNNTFKDCYVTDCQQGFVLGQGAAGNFPGEQYGPRKTLITNCLFENIKQQAVYLVLGSGNTIKDSKLINVGNNGGGNATAHYPQIYFNTHTNTVENTQSDRVDNLANPGVGYTTVPYVPEVAGHGSYASFGTRQLTLGQMSNYTLLFRLPVSTDQFGNPWRDISYSIDYVYRSTSSDFSRRGTIKIIADIDNKLIQLVDEYDLVGISEVNGLKLELRGQLLDETGAVYTIGQIPYSIAVQYRNTLASDAGFFIYSYNSTF